MHIQHFSGATMAEAIAGVREALGPDALILSTKTHRGKRGARIEVTAAPEGALPELSKSKVNTPVALPGGQELAPIRALVAPLEQELKELTKTVRGAARSGDNALADEIAALRSIAEKLMVERAMPEKTEPPGTILTSVGIDAQIARDHESRVSERLEMEESPLAAARSVLGEILEERCAPPRTKGVRREVFVGPAGSGKSTTLARLAGMRLRAAPLRMGAQPGRHVGVVACDTRDGYDSALRAYCFRNALPFRTVRNASDLRTALREMGRRHTFVELSEEAVREISIPSLREVLGKRVRSHVVASAIARREELLAELLPFEELRPDALILTRVDALTAWHEVANLLLSKRVPPLTWLGRGPDPYAPLELADPTEIVEQIAGAS